MAGINGRALELPPIGQEMVPGALYVARGRVGYGASDRSAGGASDGCHKWLDSAGVVSLFTIPASSSDFTSDGLCYKGLIVHDVFSVVKVAFAGATAITIGDCGDAAGYLGTTEVTPGTTGVRNDIPSSVFSKPAYGQGFSRAGVYNTTDVDQIELTFTGDATAGILDVYVVYSMADFSQLANTDWPNS